MKKINKTILGLVLVSIISIVLAVQFSSNIAVAVCCVCLIASIVLWERSINLDFRTGVVVPPSIGELVDRNLTPKTKNKILQMSPEQKERMAKQFVREIGSDTGPIHLGTALVTKRGYLKKYEIKGDNLN